MDSAQNTSAERILRTVEGLVRCMLRDATTQNDGSNTNVSGAEKGAGIGTDAMDVDSEATSGSAQQVRPIVGEERIKSLIDRITPSVVSDEMHVVDIIRKKLLRDDPSNRKAMRFNYLHSKLEAMSVPQDRWAILYFLSSLSDQNVTSTASSTSGSRHALPQQAPLPFFGLQNLEFSNRARERERARELNNRDREERTNAATQPDTATSTASRHDSMQENVRHRRAAAGMTASDETTASGAETASTLRNGEVDESMLLRDLMFIFQGIDGKLVRFEPDSGTCIIDPNSFCAALQHELTEYFRLIAVLESHISKEPSATKHSASSTRSGLTLKRLIVWTQDFLQRLRLMSVLVDCCQGLQGGALVSMIHDYTQHGDPIIQQFINHMLEKVSTPFYVMLQRWIYEGELEDPRTEFFIACNPDVEEQDLWQKKYCIREDMLPAFIGDSLAKKILSIGKSLNFLRHSCDDADWLAQNHGVGKTLKYGDIAELESSIDAAYMGTSQRLLHLLLTKFKLMEHLTAIKRYLLLGQGDLIQHLMESLGPSLNQSANVLFRHNLTGTLESALRSSNAQYDDPDVVRRLDVRLLEISPGDNGWDVFSLDYHVDSPINTILTPTAMHQYLRMFNFLWRLKRVEYALSSAWRQQTTGARALRPIQQLVPELHQCRIVCSEMIHFVYQLQYYILFEVLECSWDELVKCIESKTTDLDSLIEAHTKYLRDVTSKGLLSAASPHDHLQKQSLMMPRLLQVLNTILEYKGAQDRLYNFALAEIERRERLQKTADRRTQMGQWGLTDEDQELDRIPDEQFEELVPFLLRSVNEFAMKFKRELADLLWNLAIDGQESDLRFLSFRLNFNEFYISSNSSHPLHGAARRTATTSSIA
ncbi:Gamma-tubulin complex component 3 [Actinomortierella wolfii]|nr:Gamma-tubulin complex component 3 [Actinomortierella wolfii]